MNIPVLTFIDGQFKAEHSSDLSLLNNSDISLDLSDGFSLTLHSKAHCSLHLKLLGDHPDSFNKKITLENQATCLFVEESMNAAFHMTTELQLHSAARMQYYTLRTHPVQNEQFSILQQQASHLELFVSDHNVKQIARTIHAKLLEPDAVCHIQGLYSLLHDSYALSNDILIEHLAEKGVSSMLFKGVLDKKSKASFTGRVYVHPSAQETQAKQANHNLLLSKEAEIQTKPELEIYADDVKCAHGATVGQLDEDALFYLRARGIEKEEAHQLLVEAFIMELVNTISDSNIKDYIKQRVMYHAEC
jgi:Fe-S cluster assembly protein SufD